MGYLPWSVTSICSELQLLISLCQSPYVLDATRTSDQKLVMLKQISKELHPFEVEIGHFFSTEPRSSDPRNHCVPILEILQDPMDEDYQIIVMPLLRLQNRPPFETVGEILELFRQLFEVRLSHCWLYYLRLSLVEGARVHA